MSDKPKTDTLALKEQIYQAGLKAVRELIKVAEEPIIGAHEEDLSADKLKNAAMAKRVAIEDAYTILGRIEQEKENDQSAVDGTTGGRGFAENRSPKQGGA